MLPVAHELSELLDEREFLLAELDMTFVMYRTLRTLLNKQRGYAETKGIQLPDTSQFNKSAAAAEKLAKLEEAKRNLAQAHRLAAKHRPVRSGDRRRSSARGGKLGESDSDYDDDDGPVESGVTLDDLTKVKDEDEISIASVLSGSTVVRYHGNRRSAGASLLTMSLSCVWLCVKRRRRRVKRAVNPNSKPSSTRLSPRLGWATSPPCW